MIHLSIICDWDTLIARIEIARINPQTGAYETNRYLRKRFSPSAKRLCNLLNFGDKIEKDNSRYTRYFWGRLESLDSMSEQFLLGRA